MKKLVFITILFFSLHGLKSQSFYDLNTIQVIDISFSQSNWNALLNASKSSGNYLMAQSVAINGVVFDSVGVKYKGNSTYSANKVKNPWHIELDTYKNQDYQGYKDIKLSNVAKDPSFLREVLSYQIIRKYMDAPLSNYAMVYVNGNLIGLYSSSESITKTFVDDRFGSKSNTFFKCNPVSGAGPGTNSFPNLSFLGQNISSYNSSYELKSPSGWGDLVNLCDTLSNHTSFIDQILDVDKALWMLALDNVLVNLDSYIGGFKQNYYLYRMDNGRFASIIWDLNESFGQFPMISSAMGPGSILTNTNSKIQMTHTLQINSSSHPLVKELLSIPLYKRMYLAHIKTILKENFDNSNYYTIAQNLHSMIDSCVQLDANKFFSYSNFLSNINSDVSGTGGGPGGGSSPGIKNLIDNRSNYLLNQPDFTAVEPTINQISQSNQNPALGQNIFITASVANENSVFLGFRSNSSGVFERVLMLDDGAHGDGVANDGVYGQSINISSPDMQYYIYAENSTIGKFSPVRAEYEYHNINTSSGGGSGLVINELMASNNSTIADNTGMFSDWIEIYNNSPNSINLGDYFLTDKFNNPNKFNLPNENLNSGGYKLIWASGDTSKGINHTNFKLSKSGEMVGLFRNNAIIDTIDYIYFSEQTTDTSFGREYDASPKWVFFFNTTPNSSNGTLSVVKPKPKSFTAYPNPHQNQVIFENSSSKELIISIITAQGVLIEEFIVLPNTKRTWLDNHSSGIRIINFINSEQRGQFKLLKL